MRLSDIVDNSTEMKLIRVVLRDVWRAAKLRLQSRNKGKQHDVTRKTGKAGSKASGAKRKNQAKVKNLFKRLPPKTQSASNKPATPPNPKPSETQKKRPTKHPSRTTRAEWSLSSNDYPQYFSGIQSREEQKDR